MKSGETGTGHTGSMMKSATKRDFIHSRIKDEIQTILTEREIDAGTDRYDIEYDYLYSKLISDPNRDWSYEYEHYCSLLNYINMKPIGENYYAY